MVRLNPDVDPARCQSCASGRHLSCTGMKNRDTECVCTHCMGYERSTTWHDKHLSRSTSFR